METTMNRRTSSRRSGGFLALGLLLALILAGSVPIWAQSLTGTDTVTSDDATADAFDSDTAGDPVALAAQAQREPDCSLSPTRKTCTSTATMGDATLGATRTATATVKASRAPSGTLNNRLDYALLGKRGRCASVVLKVTPQGGTANVKLGAQTVLSRQIRTGAHFEWDPYHLVFTPQPEGLFSVFGSTVRVSGQVTCHAQATGTWEFRPDRVRLKATGQTWGTGIIKSQADPILYAGTPYRKMTATFFNSTLTGNLRATASSVEGSHARLEVKPWKIVLECGMTTPGGDIPCPGPIVVDRGPAEEEIFF
jgi:hypothetical protein